MRYYMFKEENVVMNVATLDADGDGNITEETYLALVEMFHDRPENNVIIESEGLFSYAEVEPQETDIDDTEVFDILFGGES